MLSCSDENHRTLCRRNTNKMKTDHIQWSNWKSQQDFYTDDFENIERDLEGERYVRAKSTATLGMTVHLSDNYSSHGNTLLECLSLVKCSLTNTAVHDKYNEIWFLKK